jgi:hypothetical protein
MSSNTESYFEKETLRTLMSSREDKFLVNSPLLGYATTEEAVLYAVRAEQQQNSGVIAIRF